MKNIYVFILVCMISAVNISQAQAAQNLTNKEFTMEAANLFWKKKIPELNQKLETYRASKQRTVDGSWVSNVYYNSLSSLVSPKFTDKSTWDGVLKTVENWIKTHPNSPSGYLVRAGLYHRYAGKFYNEDPRATSMASYYEHLKKSRDYLMSTKKVSSQDPYWYVRMLTILNEMKVKDKVFQKVMEEGVARYPEYGPIYMTAMDYLAPKWRGNRKKVAGFANAVAGQTYKTDGMGMFVRVYWRASELFHDKGALFEDDELEWSKIERGMQDILKHYSEKTNINKFAYISCLAQDRSLTRTLMTQIKKPIHAVWKSKFKDCKEYAETNNELSLRNDIQMDVIKLFWRQDFKRLNKLSDDYRKNEERTGSGLWKLTMFYRGVSGVLSTKQASPEKWKKAFGISEAWIKQYPNSSAAHLSKAMLLQKYALKFRGGGWAKDVPDEAWAIINKYNEDARQYLLSTKEISSQDPQWYSEMIEVLRYTSDADKMFESVLQEGMKKHPGYYDMYFSAAFYLLPVWHGSKEKMEAFVSMVAEQTKDTEGMGLYARIYWHVGSIVDRKTLYSDYNVNWPKMKQGMFDVAKKYPDQWNINSFAFFSCLAQDHGATRAFFKQLTIPYLHIWEDAFQVCKNYAEQGAKGK